MKNTKLDDSKGIRTIPELHNPGWTPSRMNTIPNGHHSKGHNPECTQSRMDTIPKDTIPNVHNPESTQSQMYTIPSRQNLERARSQMDTIQSGHDSKWTPYPEWTE